MCRRIKSNWEAVVLMLIHVLCFKTTWVAPSYISVKTVICFFYCVTVEANHHPCKADPVCVREQHSPDERVQNIAIPTALQVEMNHTACAEKWIFVCEELHLSFRFWKWNFLPLHIFQRAVFVQWLRELSTPQLEITKIDKSGANTTKTYKCFTQTHDTLEIYSGNTDNDNWNVSWGHYSAEQMLAIPRPFLHFYSLNF